MRNRTRNPAKGVAAQFLCHLVAAVPYQIHTVLTDNGIQFTSREPDRHAFAHIFARVCRETAIEHRLTKTTHPWTNGQVGRLNRTITEAPVKRDHHDDHDQLRSHLADFLAADNFARRLKTLNGLPPTNTPVKSGQRSRNASGSTQSITCRD